MKTNKAIMQLNVIIDGSARVEMGPSTIESIPVKTQIAILKMLDRVGDNINKILEKDNVIDTPQKEDVEDSAENGNQEEENPGDENISREPEDDQFSSPQ